MGTHQDEEAGGGRVALAIGLLIAGGAAAAAFGRVYQGAGVTVRLVLLCWASIALAAILERQHVLLATAVSAAALILAIGWFVFPETTRWWLPTLATFKHIGKALSDVGREAQVTPAPAIPVDPLLLAGIVAVWTAGFASHSLATRARSPFLALAPQAALLAFAGIVVDDGARPGYVFLFLAGSLAVLFADAVRRVGQWGTLSVWHGKRRVAGVASRTTTRGAWRVAAGCLGVALFLPWLLPGFGSRSLLALQSGPAESVSLNPIVDIRPRLVLNPALPLFTVTGATGVTGAREEIAPTYWQLITEDRFDGRTWTSSDPQAARGEESGSGPLPDPTGTASIAAPDVVAIHEHIVLQKLGGDWLPAGATPVGLSIDGTIRYDPLTGTVVIPGLTSEGFAYDVTSNVVVPTPEELNAVPGLDTTPGVYNELPPDLPPQIAQLARAWTADATTPYQKIMAIQARLRSWSYTLRPPKAPDGNDLLYFLTVSHRGFCQQFAGSMAALLRALGYPARVAVGFLPGRYDPKIGGWRVSSSDSHAWVQVLFPGYGWLSFDPTPTRFQGNPTIARYDNPISTGGLVGSLCAPGEKLCTPEGATGAGGTGIHKGRGLDNTSIDTDPAGALTGLISLPSPASARRSLADWRRIGLIALGVVVLVLLVAIPLARSIRRRVRLRRRGSSRDRVLTAYGVFLETAGEVGHRRRSAETIQEFQRRVSRSVRFTNGDFAVLSGLAGRAAYAEDGLEPDDGSRAATLCRTTSKDLRRAVPWWRNLVGRYPIPPPDERAA